MRLRINRQTHVTLLDGAEQRIDLGERLNFVAEHFHPVGVVIVGGINLDHIPTHAKRPAAEIAFGTLVKNLDQLAGNIAALDLLSLFEEQQHAVVGLGRAQSIDATDRGDDQTIPPLEQRPRGREPQLVELVVDGRFLLNIKVRRRHIGLGLVVVVVGDEVLDGVVGEEAFEFVVELGSQGLVVRHDQGRPVCGLDHLGGGVGLARSGDPEQHLMLLAIEYAAGEGFDGLCLVALGFVVANQLEVHKSL